MIFAFSLGDSVVNHFASLCGLFSMIVGGWRGQSAGTYDFALPREQDQVAGGVSTIRYTFLRFEGLLDGHLDCCREKGRGMNEVMLAARTNLQKGSEVSG
jgi:hypothetical protein